MTTPVSETEKVNLSKYIDNSLMSGRPHIRGRRVPVWSIQSAFESGLTIDEIASELPVTPEQVLAALLYYREHKAEIDMLVEEDNRIHAEMREKQDESWKQRWENRKRK